MIRKMINYDYAKKKTSKEYNPNLSQILDFKYRILIIEGSGSGNTNALTNLVKQNDDND